MNESGYLRQVDKQCTCFLVCYDKKVYYSLGIECSKMLIIDNLHNRLTSKNHFQYIFKAGCKDLRLFKWDSL